MYIITRVNEYAQRYYVSRDYKLVKDEITEDCIFERIGDAMKVAGTANKALMLVDGKNAPLYQVKYYNMQIFND